MNARGQYGGANYGVRGIHVGASLVHALELKQRYDNAKAVAVQAILSELAQGGVASSAGTNRWEIALPDAEWVRLVWYPDHAALEVTITDRALHQGDEIPVVRRRYEQILSRITPSLQRYGATTVGATIVGSTFVAGTHVGLKIFNTPDDTDIAVRQIDSQMNAIMDAMYRAMGADPSVRTAPFTWDEIAKIDRKDPRWEDLSKWKERVLAAKAIATKSPLWTFFDSNISPTYGEWQEFRRSDKFMTWFRSVETYEKWLERVRKLRKEVQAKGIRLETADPVDFTKTLPGTIIDTAGEAAKKAGEAAWDIFKIMKWGAIGALGIGALVALSSLVSNLRKGKDPAEKYVELIREGRGRSARALPEPRAQLALPPGEPETLA